MNSFTQMINYVASAIDLIGKNSTSSTRQIAEYHSGRGGRGRNNNRGGTRGGGRFGRNGRGRGRHNNRTDQSSAASTANANTNTDNRPITRGYSRQEWLGMTQAQRNRVSHERERLETVRAVAAVMRDELTNNANDDLSTITGTVPQRIQTDSAQNTNNSTGSNAITGVTRSINQVSLENASQAFTRRRLNAYTSMRIDSHRGIASMNVDNSFNEILQCRVELDSHADTCGVNHVARIIEFHGQVAQVSGFAESMEPMKDIPIVKAALAYDIPETGETVILIINQALYFGKHLSHVLLNPNQMRYNNVIVDDIPKHLSSMSTHSITVTEENVTIPLQLNGIISYFDARTPTTEEIENCPHIILTSDEEWNPYSSHFAEKESEAV